MDCLLISSGLVQNVVTVDSLEAAVDAYPGFDAYIERTGNVGVGWAYDGQSLLPPSMQPQRRLIWPHDFYKRLPDDIFSAVALDQFTDENLAKAKLLIEGTETGKIDLDSVDTLRYVGYLKIKYALSNEAAAALLA